MTPHQDWHTLVATMVCLVILLGSLAKWWSPAPSPVAVSLPCSEHSCNGFLFPSVVSSFNESLRSEHLKQERQVDLLVEIWSKSLDEGSDASVPSAPHFQDCQRCTINYRKLDSRGDNGDRPHWTIWRGALGVELGGDIPVEDQSEEMLLNGKGTVEGPYVPWVQGGDEDNLPMTRRAQRDIWLHQHPRNCSKAKFLLADWQSDLMPGRSIGAGAELVAMSGMLAVALKDKRVLVTKDYHGANHTGCNGAGHSRWSCYFVPEAAQECIDRALQLSSQESAWKQGLITSNKNYPPNVCWNELPVPGLWGKPWETVQRTLQLNGNLLGDYQAENRRWWRSQAFRYLMRFPSEYLCRLLNRARHEAFGHKAAELVVPLLPPNWPQVQYESPEKTPIEKLVWSSSGPWMPRPLVSVHVRQGDKGGEMRLFDFKHYMKLCDLLKGGVPDARNIWLSTEMENVIRESRNYSGWNFYFTKIQRQTGTTSMSSYMASLGKQKSFDNSFVNLWMAADADYFVGALGSTWSSLIDALRITGGKVMAGFLTVNNINALL